jgi:hypothetical protein
MRAQSELGHEDISLNVFNPIRQFLWLAEGIGAISISNFQFLISNFPGARRQTLPELWA